MGAGSDITIITILNGGVEYLPLISSPTSRTDESRKTAPDPIFSLTQNLGPGTRD